MLGPAVRTVRLARRVAQSCTGRSVPHRSPALVRVCVPHDGLCDYTLDYAID